MNILCESIYTHVYACTYMCMCVYIFYMCKYLHIDATDLSGGTDSQGSVYNGAKQRNKRCISDLKLWPKTCDCLNLSLNIRDLSSSYSKTLLTCLRPGSFWSARDTIALYSARPPALPALCHTFPPPPPRSEFLITNECNSF